MKFFTTSQIRQLDQYTIDHEPIFSIDLMERAANVLLSSITEIYSTATSLCIFAGPGNNGGDALALSRLLMNSGYQVSVILIHAGSLSHDCEVNRERLIKAFPGSVTELDDHFIEPEIQVGTIIIDGLFGSGLSRPITGLFARAIEWINQTDSLVISIDIPSGLSGEQNAITEDSVIIKADLTLSLQFPKLSFMMSENASYIGNREVLPIGIHPDAIDMTASNLMYLEKADIAPLLRKRDKFSHKGTFGHALILAGSKGMAGASVLSSRAALRSGAGLVTVHGPAANRVIVQTANPEVIFQNDSSDNIITKIESLESYTSIAIGSGMGTHSETIKMVNDFLKKLNRPCVFDADALNIISQQKELLKQIPKNSILTPHPKEFDRLFGEHHSTYDRITKARQASEEYGIIIVLKGSNTVVASPDGKLNFNSTGNPGMATAGSGDVLTGILVGLLAQGYSPEDTAKIGVYLHGLAGDLALTNESQESLLAGDIINSLGKAFRSIQE